MSLPNRDDALLFEKRILELAGRADASCTFTFTDFLGLYEQDIFRCVQNRLPRGTRYTLFGGAEGAERMMVRFGDEEELGYEIPFPIVMLHILPRAPKFAQKLSHRDVLGALMHLGIEREMLGDIVLREEGREIFVFAHEKIAPFIESELQSIRNTQVTVSVREDVPEGELYHTESVVIKAMSERLDGIIAKVYSLSREEASGYFARSLVFAEGRCVTSPSYIPKENERISVRGLGRFLYEGYISDTKKGKLNLRVQKYV